MHIIRFLEDPHSRIAREIGWTSADTLARAMAIAARRWPSVRESFGPDAGYVIEDPLGRRVLVMLSR